MCKKVLITGANSYIGTSIDKYLSQWPDKYKVNTIDMCDDNWKSNDFAGYDVVVHVAGIAHIKETAENAQDYFRVNRDLAFETAKKAKKDGVNLFVFLSSMSVYGLDEGAINLNTVPQPKSNYGKSKLEAEELISNLVGEQFKVAVLRPPMVYGDGCKGNYQSLVSFAKKLPFFPDYKNTRSMIHIDNLASYIKNIIDNDDSGLFLPQDSEYVCTCEMVKEIAAKMGKDIKLLKILNPAVSILKRFTSKGRKAFGDLYYEK